MKKRLLSIITFVMIAGAAAYGQTVTGKVSSAADGSPLPGVSILLKGSSTGTFSDADGKYAITLPEGTPGAVLIASFIGFTTQEVAVENKTILDITLAEDSKALNEVVVTALGIPRETKTLVYATQSIKPSTLTEVRDPNNVINSLAGKVVNAQINQGSGGPGSGARIVLRGNRSIQGSNNALIVVDGVPINNSTSSAASSDFGSVQGSDGASSINPDDIESMTILRGASAAALYGSDAGNGVVLITTKKGTKDAMSITVNSGVQAERPFQLPNVQNSYGQGLNGNIDNTVGSSWGAPMQGQSYTTTEGDTRSYSAQPKNISNFFRTGYSLNNSIGIQGGTSKMQSYMSYTNNVVDGIIPFNDMVRHTTTFRITNQVSDKFSTDAKVTYLNQNINNRPRTGEENAPVIDVYNMPRSLSIGDAKNYMSINNVGNPAPTPWPSTLNSVYQNPYWMLKQTNITEKRDRIMGFLSAKYKFTPWLSITGRANLDKTSDVGNQRYADQTLLWVNQPGGYIDQSRTTITQQWYDAILEGENKFAKDFKINYHAGVIWFDTRYDGVDASTQGLTVTNKYSLNYASNPTISQSTDGYRKESTFGQFSLGWKEGIFIEGSLRNEWDSRLRAPHTYSYPSIGGTAIISELITLPTTISFLKINANYAKVGNGGQSQLLTTPYYYSQGAGNGFLYRSSTESLPNLKPELVGTYEIGVDVKVLENRLGISATYYDAHSTNQLLSIGLPVATGYNTRYINAGLLVNKGLEIVLSATPIKNDRFTWDMNFNFGMNRNRVIRLLPDLKTTYVGGAGDGRTASVVVSEGGRYGDLWSLQWAKAPSGKYIVGADGLPVATTTPASIGNFNPNALLGWSNTLSFGRFSARVLIDGRVGGIIVDGTEMNLAFDGITKATAEHRTDNTWTLGGVQYDADTKTETPNTKTITAQEFWQAGSNKTTGLRYGVGEFFAYHATNFRVREVSFGYGIPVPSTFFIKSARISFIARNLFWLYKGSALLDIPGLKKRTMQVDPDMSLGNNNYQGISYAALPSTRSIGLNLKLTF